MPTAYNLKLISDLFDNLGWELKSPKFSNAHSAFAQISEKIGDDEFELLIDLTKDFTAADYLAFQEYYEKAASIINSITSNLTGPIAIIPVMSTRDEDQMRVKSGHQFCYTLRNAFLNQIPTLQGRDIRDFLSPGLFRESDINTPDTHLICVDDFVGTGTTVIDFIKNHENDSLYIQQQTSVVSFASMREGFDLLMKGGIDFHTTRVLEKGITDNARIKDKKKYFDVMNSMESLLNVPPAFCFGFGKSESLVSMYNTPDNTFPIYWITEKYIPTDNPNRSDFDWPSPFPRT